MNTTSGNRFSFFEGTATPDTGVDVNMTLYDADMQFTKVIASEGGADEAETFTTMIDNLDWYRDSGPWKVIEVVSDGAFTFDLATYSPPNVMSSDIEGSLDADTTPDAYYTVSVTLATEYEFIYHSYDAVTGDPIDTAVSNNTWICFWKLDGDTSVTGRPISYGNVAAHEIISLVDGVYMIWVSTGDADTQSSHYGRCGSPANLNVNFTLSISQYTAPTPMALDLYDTGMFSATDRYSYEIDLISGDLYYFYWETDVEFTVTVYDFLDSADMIEIESFMYEPLFGGTFTISFLASDLL
jgi:hypothetical protein